MRFLEIVYPGIIAWLALYFFFTYYKWKPESKARDLLKKTLVLTAVLFFAYTLLNWKQINLDIATNYTEGHAR